MIFDFFKGKKKISVNVSEMKGLMRGIGLMFRRSSTTPLLFAFETANRTAITSVFVFFPFLAVWLDEKKKVIECRKIGPFRLSILPKNDSKYLVEIPIHEKNHELIENILDNHV